MDDLLFILSLSLKLFTLYFAAVAVFTLCRRRKYPRTAPRTKFAVVVAARNEEAVIGNLVHSVLSQDYPASLRDIYVVPNNCTDFTEAAAVAAGARIIHCVGPVSVSYTHLPRSQLRGPIVFLFRRESQRSQ